jgi:anti-anti-sigma regulatory factor
MDFRVEEIGPQRLKVTGELDMVTEGDLVEACLKVGPGDLWLEISEMDFIDSMGIKALMTILRSRPDKLILEGAQPQARRVLHLVKADTWDRFVIA